MEKARQFIKKLENIDWMNSANIQQSGDLTIFDDYDGTSAFFENSMICAMDILNQWIPKIGDRPEPEDGLGFNHQKQIFEVLYPVTYAKGILKNCIKDGILYVNMKDAMLHNDAVQEWCEQTAVSGANIIFDEESDNLIIAFDIVKDWIDEKNIIAAFVASKLKHDLSSDREDMGFDETEQDLGINLTHLMQESS